MTEVLRFNKNNLKEVEITFECEEELNEGNYILKSYHDNGDIKSISYFNKHKLHNCNGPAETWYYYNNKKKMVCFYINGLCTNKNGPAILKYNENGILIEEKYFLNGKIYKDKLNYYLNIN